MFHAAAVRFHAKEIGGTFAVGCEDDRRPIGRPHRVVVDLRSGEERLLVRAVGVGDEDAELASIWKDAGKHNFLRGAAAGSHSEQGGRNEESRTENRSSHRAILLLPVRERAGSLGWFDRKTLAASECGL